MSHTGYRGTITITESGGTKGRGDSGYRGPQEQSVQGNRGSEGIKEQRVNRNIGQRGTEGEQV